MRKYLLFRVFILCCNVVVFGNNDESDEPNSKTIGNLEKTVNRKRSSGKISEIKFSGLHRIENRTASSYISIFPGDQYDDDSINNAIKDLIATGFFESVSAEKSGNAIIFRVKEYPIINKISFEGNSKISDKDIRKEIKFRSREVLSPAKIREAQQALLDIYRRLGRFNAKVELKIIKLNNDRVNLVFEINEGTPAYIQDIIFVGNKHFSSGELRDTISSKIKHWYRFFVVDDIYDGDRLFEDRILLKRFYLENGFADCRIVSAIGKLSLDKSGFVIIFTIDEGEMYQFENISVKSEINTIKGENFERDLYCKNGEKYKGSFVEIDVKSISDKIGEMGFAAISVDPQLKKDKINKKIDVNYCISQGKKSYISRIIIKGNTRTRDHVIRREIPIEEGDAYNSSLVSLAENNLRNTGFFGTVSVNTVSSPDDPDKLILEVSVTEKPTGEITFGLGYETHDGPIIDMAYRDKNFSGTGKVLGISVCSCRSRCGARSKEDDKDGIHSSTMNEYSVVRKSRFKFLNSVDVAISDPHFLDTDVEGSIDFFKYSNGRWDSFTSNELGISSGIAYWITTKIRQEWEYTIALRRFADVFEDSSPIIKYFIMKRQRRIISNTKTAKSTLSSLKHTISYLDHFLKKLNGMFSIGLGTTIAGLGGNAKHLKNELFGSYSFSIFNASKLSFGFSTGLLSTVGGKSIHVVDSFGLGLDSFRGFDDCGLGPRVETFRWESGRGKQIQKSFKEYIGAKRYWRGTIELTFPIGLPEELQFRGSIFTDFGTVYSAPENGKGIIKTGPNGRCAFDKSFIKSTILDSRRIRMSIGLSISFVTPLGPLKLTYAIPVKKNRHDVSRRILLGYSTSI